MSHIIKGGFGPVSGKQVRGNAGMNQALRRDSRRNSGPRRPGRGGKGRGWW